MTDIETEGTSNEAESEQGRAPTRGERAELVLKKYKKESKMERWLDEKTSPQEVFEEIMEEGGPYRAKIEKKEIPLIKRTLKSKVIEGGVGVEEPFREGIERNIPFMHEIKRLMKRQAEMATTFNALAEMMPMIERIGDEEEEVDMDEMYEDLSRVWKVAVLEQTLALRNITNDLKELQYRACGIKPPGEEPTISTFEEGEKEKVEEKLKEKRIGKRREYGSRNRGRGRPERDFPERRGKRRGRGRGSLY